MEGSGRALAAGHAWRRPGWAPYRPSPRWILLSSVVHASLVAGWIVFGRAPSGAEAPLQVMVCRVLGSAPAPEPPPSPPVPRVLPEERDPPPPAETVLVEPFFPEPEQAVDTQRPARDEPLPDLTRIRPEEPETRPIEPDPPEDEPRVLPRRDTPGTADAPLALDERNRPPPYPERAIRLRLQGTVVLHVVVGADGKVASCSVRISSGHDLLDRAAREAVEGWVFLKGPGELDLPIEFVLRARGAVVAAPRPPSM
ncbi:MAG: hypothetical protein Fur0037_16790 [Planctomycetota bacterium]